jgi:hypothetical protein
MTSVRRLPALLGIAALALAASVHFADTDQFSPGTSDSAGA